jgi:hypothetical protein
VKRKVCLRQKNLKRFWGQNVSEWELKTALQTKPAFQRRVSKTVKNVTQRATALFFSQFPIKTGIANHFCDNNPSSSRCMVDERQRAAAAAFEQPQQLQITTFLCIYCPASDICAIHPRLPRRLSGIG